MTDSSAAAAKTRRPTAIAQRVTTVLGRPNGGNSVDQGLGQGMEMAITVVVFLGIGWLLDLAFDTQPVFMIALVVFSVVGQFVKMWFVYDARMKTLEAERRRGPWPTSTTPGRTDRIDDHDRQPVTDHHATRR